MIYVEKIEIVNNSYPSNFLKKGFEIIFEDVNLLVGNQGVGKSTLLRLMQQNHSDIKLTLSKDCIEKDVETFFFDAEIDNPRTKDPQLFTKPNGESIGIGFINATMSRFRSHGETLYDFTVGAIKNAENCVLFVDEPESGLSITNQFKLIDSIKEAIRNGCQLFVATHCYPLINEFNVISLEHMKRMTGKEFIDSVK